MSRCEFCAMLEGLTEENDADDAVNLAAVAAFFAGIHVGRTLVRHVDGFDAGVAIIRAAMCAPHRRLFDAISVDIAAKRRIVHVAGGVS